MSDLEHSRRGIIPQIKKACRLLIAFTFSHVGVCGLVVGYIIFGAFLFQYIESESYKNVQLARTEIRQLRTETAENLLKIMLTSQIDKDNYLKDAEGELINFTSKVVKAFTEKGYDGERNSTHSNSTSSIQTQWGFSGAFLYSLTVITTIGYGNAAPITPAGKVTTIVYGIVGMPLFLLYLSNIGDILARGFKFIYAKCCQCRWNCARRNSRDRSSDDGGSNSFDMIPDDEQITVPISVCLVLMVAYIWGGGIWFASTEDWSVLDASYFCFISLSTIGFGDLVPGMSYHASELQQIQVPFIFCSVYLLLGMALIAMCFNLGQQEVIASVKRIASRLGILKEEGVR